MSRTELTQKYFNRLEDAIEEQSGYEYVKKLSGHWQRQTAEELLELAVAYESLNTPRAMGMARYARELAEQKREAVA